MESLHLHYTGHPLFDIGLAAITTYMKKHDPADLLVSDLEKVADYIEENYTAQPLSSFLTVSLMNSDFTQPAFKDNLERRREYARLVARSLSPELHKSDEICVFTGQPALSVPLSLKQGKDALPPGRAYRQHIPLVTGERIINFSPWGDPGLPVSGPALLCLQFFPMGCLKCGGRLLAVHSDNPKIIQYFAGKALKENHAAISQARVRGESKMPDLSSSAQTLLINNLMSMDIYQNDERDASRPFSVTAYHLTNSGQSSPLDEKSPLLKIYPLPMEMVSFLITLKTEHQQAWKELVRRGWEIPKPSKKTSDDNADGSLSNEKRRRNYLFEDLLRLPEYTKGFVRQYLLRIPKRSALPTDPRGEYNIRQDIALISWQITALLLEKVVNMDKQRIEEVRKLGDTLAAYIQEQEDDNFFRDFYRTPQAGKFRGLLLRANYKYVKAGHEPLLKFDPYLVVFEEGKDLIHSDWRFIRDLVLIRIIEQLHANQYFSRHPEALPDDTDLETSQLDNE